jgi:hypothetical protein
LLVLLVGTNSLLGSGGEEDRVGQVERESALGLHCCCCCHDAPASAASTGAHTLKVAQGGFEQGRQLSVMRKAPTLPVESERRREIAPMRPTLSPSWALCLNRRACAGISTTALSAGLAAASVSRPKEWPSVLLR